MRPDVTQVNLRRWIAGLAAGVVFAASPALAGDRALANFIGFSPDARYFAFEEYGIESDSGLAYSNVHLIDLGADSRLEDKWVSSIAEDGERSDDLTAVRAETSRKAAALVTQHNIVVPAEIAALNGDGEPDLDPARLSVIYPVPSWGTVTKTYTLAVTFFSMPAAADCTPETQGAPQGYELRISSGLAETVLHRDDDVLPAARGCPQFYALYAVVIPGIGATKERGVAILSYYPSGFEGASRRFLAVPFTP